jgi:hypothetical protein
MKRPFLIALLPAAAIAAMSALAFAQNPSTGPTLYSIKELMDSVVDPSADDVWGAVGTVVDKAEGIKEMIPKTEEEWAAVRRASVRIAEAGNLLAMPGRRTAPPGTKSETPGVELEPEEMDALIRGNRIGFESFARALNGIGRELVGAADEKNADKILEIGARMEDVCESCHQTFWYPPKR